MSLWQQIGLALDLVGGALIALTAWFRLKVSVSPLGAQIGVSEDASEPTSGLRWRRRIVVIGGILLSAGFALQMVSTRLQIP